MAGGWLAGGWQVAGGCRRARGYAGVQHHLNQTLNQHSNQQVQRCRAPWQQGRYSYGVRLVICHCFHPSITSIWRGPLVWVGTAEVR
jgi:hypothetical protein